MAIEDPRACFTTALDLPWHCQPCGVGVVCICPAQKSITPSLHWWEVLGVESQAQKGVGLMLASSHLASVVPELLQSLVVLRRDDTMAANKTIDLVLDHLGRLWELRGRSVA